MCPWHEAVVGAWDHLQKCCLRQEALRESCPYSAISLWGATGRVAELILRVGLRTTPRYPDPGSKLVEAIMAENKAWEASGCEDKRPGFLMFIVTSNRWPPARNSIWPRWTFTLWAAVITKEARAYRWKSYETLWKLELASWHSYAGPSHPRDSAPDPCRKILRGELATTAEPARESYYYCRGHSPWAVWTITTERLTLLWTEQRKCPISSLLQNAEDNGKQQELIQRYSFKTFQKRVCIDLPGFLRYDLWYGMRLHASTLAWIHLPHFTDPGWSDHLHSLPSKCGCFGMNWAATSDESNVWKLPRCLHISIS